MKQCLTWIVAVSLFATTGALAQRSKDQTFKNPEFLVKELLAKYGEHKGKTVVKSIVEEPEKVLNRYFSPKLVKLLLQDRAAKAKTDEIVGLDFDLLSGTQDPPVLENLRVVLVPKTNTVRVTYDISKGKPGMKIDMKMAKLTAGWRISDMVYYQQDGTQFTLLSALSRP